MDFSRLFDGLLANVENPKFSVAIKVRDIPVLQFFPSSCEGLS
jgi:hypothetical protein